jgi:hypothetical protein
MARFLGFIGHKLLDCGPPAPSLVQAIITGNSPALRALDTEARA